MACIEKLYTSENMGETEYYEKVKNTIRYLENINPYEKDKSDVKKEFRNIVSYPIIPKILYDENREKIENYLDKIREDYSKDINLRNQQRIEKFKAKMAIREYSLNVQDYDLMGSDKDVNLNNFDKIQLGRYEEIYILDCYYDFEVGFKVKKQSEKKHKEPNFF